MTVRGATTPAPAARVPPPRKPKVARLKALPSPPLPPSGGLVDKLHMANADGGEVKGGGNGGGHKHFDLGKGLV